MPILINRRTRPNSLSFRGNEETVGISRKGNVSTGDRRQFFLIIRVRLFSFLLRGISRLTLEMTSVSDWLYNVAPYKPSRTLEMTSCTQPIKPSPSGEGGLPKHREGKTDEGKTTLRFY